MARSEIEAQRELRLSHRLHGVINSPHRVDVGNVVIREIEIWVIKSIERFHPERQPPRLVRPHHARSSSMANHRL